jgi:hypothetical protein
MPNLIFERFELKYLLSTEQYGTVLDALKPGLEDDVYPDYSIASVYYDTESFDLIRASIEKPVYREKLRVRYYGNSVSDGDSHVFLELKKKFKRRTYKRRIRLPYRDAATFPSGSDWQKHGTVLEKQVTGELNQFLNVYKVSPSAYIRYDRKAFVGKDDPGLRVSFDSDVRFRVKNVNLETEESSPLLESGKIILEIKAAMNVPLWICRILSENRIYPSSYSKYGSCYRTHLFKKEHSHVFVSD